MVDVSFRRGKKNTLRNFSLSNKNAFSDFYFSSYRRYKKMVAKIHRVYLNALLGCGHGRKSKEGLDKNLNLC